MLGTNSPTSGPRNVFSEFFGKVTSGIGEGISRLGSEVMPVWVASELELQTKDQLARVMFDPEGRPAPIRIEGPATIGYAGTSPGDEDFFRKVWLNLGGLHITGGGLLVMVGIGLSAAYVLKKVVFK